MTEIEQCPYLIYKTSKSCASCTGYRCTSAGREKKVDSSQLETCRNEEEYINCTRYIETLPKTEEAISYSEPSPDEVLTASIDEEAKSSVSTVIEHEPYIDEIVEEEPQPPPPPKPRPCGCGNPDVRASNCPYQGPTPEGQSSCLGIWCYANNKNIRVDKNCVNWQICTVFLMSKYKGVKFYNTK